MSVTVWKPTTASELSRLVAENYQQEKHALIPVGGRTSLHFGGQNLSGLIGLSTIGLNRIVDYPARDLTITVEAGIKIEELQGELQKQHQSLPIDIPQTGRATLGGAIASNASGPSRFGYGTFRDYVIGISAVDGQGRLFSAGGRVVKNVAGYDLCKLLIGSLGTLATITEVTLKLRPLCDHKTIIIATFEPQRELEPILAGLNKSATRPVVLDLLNARAAWQLSGEVNRPLPLGKNMLWVEYEGTQAETEWQAQTLLEELQPHQPDEIVTIQNDDYAQFHLALCEFQTASDDPVTFRASLPKSLCERFLRMASAQDVSIQTHAGNGVVYGHLPDRCTTVQLANEIIQPLRQFSEEHGGALTILNCDPEWTPEIDFVGARSNSWDLMSRIKKVLDPANLLSPQRLL